MERAEAERIEQERTNANQKEQSKKDNITRLLDEGASYDK